MSRLAFLWDESYLWGVMAYRALKAVGLPFDLIRSEDVRRGTLANYRVLFVPGGWASNKMTALGEEGSDKIRTFVQGGGDYIGICGGAGLATTDGIGLLPIGRRPTKDRVPSFSGRIRLRLAEHAAWAGIGCEAGSPGGDRGQSGDEHADRSVVFHAWWPSQFVLRDGNIRCLATYGRALPDAFSSDFNVGDVENTGNWEPLEQLYGINLDPVRLENEPAVVEGTYGSGRVILSLVHFDTPGDHNGCLALRNLWTYLLGDDGKGITGEEGGSRQGTHLTSPPLGHHVTAAVTGTEEGRQFCAVVSDLLEAVAGLVSLGMRNFLWFWRNPLLLQWRRGVRGLEYCTLYVLMREIAGLFERTPQAHLHAGSTEGPDLERIRGMLLPFVDKSRRLLLLERHALQRGLMSYEKCDDPEVVMLRKELFATSKSYGGLFKELIAEVDALLFRLLQREENAFRGI